MTSFIDQATIQIKSGAGGNGIVAWRREKYVPQGGPAGGDGGRGGDVYIEATEDLSTLLDFRYKSLFKAEPGEHGGSKNMHGKSGKSLTIKVPCGTIVRDADTGLAIADLTDAGQKVLVAQGGRGGRGNARFLSSRRQAPQFAEPGEPAIERTLNLELKLIADVGIIGLPNAGKSTLISVLSAAKPKIADYPFTTLVPNLGVVQPETGQPFVMADIPGLVEGASEGIGLGHEFLRHVERTRVLIHLVDGTTEAEVPGSAWANFELINSELRKYSATLAGKQQIVVLSKLDALLDEQVALLRSEFARRHAVPESGILAISSVARTGLDALMARVTTRLAEIPAVTTTVEIVEDTRATDNDDSAFEVLAVKGGYVVEGGRIERLFSVTDMRNRAAVYRLMNILKSMGVFEALKKAGAKSGDGVGVAGYDFTFMPEGFEVMHADEDDEDVSEDV
ncbi:MAG: GTPase ObgE [Candidatus Melainabacteria bacterium]